MGTLEDPNRYNEVKRNLVVKTLRIIIDVLNHNITFMFVDR